MSKPTEGRPAAPLGVDPDVLSQINALFREPKMIVRSARRRRDSAANSVAWWKEAVPSPPGYNDTTAAPALEEAPVANPIGDGNSIKEADLEHNMENLRHPSPEDNSEEDDLKERNSLLTPDQSPGSGDISSSINSVVDLDAPKFMARYIYPSERHPGPLSPLTLSPSSPPLLPPFNEINLAHWPNITFSIMSSIESVMNFIMEDKTPGVIEYSASEVKQKMNEIQVEARISDAPKSSGATTSVPEKVVGIVAFVSVGENQPPQVVSITAKPKRVRQVLKDYGVRNVAEDVYGSQIKEALMSPRRAD